MLVQICLSRIHCNSYCQGHFKPSLTCSDDTTRDVCIDLGNDRVQQGLAHEHTVQCYEQIAHNKIPTVKNIGI